LPFSRLIWFGLRSSISATLPSGTNGRPAASGRALCGELRRGRFPGGQGDRQVAQAVYVVRIAPEGGRRGRTGGRLDTKPCLAAADGDVHHVLYVATLIAVSAPGGAIGSDGQHRQTGRLLDLHVGRPGVSRRAAAHLLGVAFHLLEIAPCTFTATSPRTPAMSSLKPGLDGLREPRIRFPGTLRRTTFSISG
jgi:hypothetical protein